ncbi:hypothetical protein ACHAWF_013035 [Thalassiosira exigua]
MYQRPMDWILPLLVALCLTLSCDARQAQFTDQVGTSSRMTYIGPSRPVFHKTRDVMRTTRHLTAFSPAASPGIRHALNKQIVCAPKIYKPKTRPAFFGNLLESYSHRKKLHYHGHKSLAFSAAKSDDPQDITEEQQKGMQEAFASLEALSADDWSSHGSNGAADNTMSSTVKYSRTDDTQAAYTGKSTKEEVGFYLEMQGELEGTSSSAHEQSDQDADENAESDVEELEMVGNESSDEYPWTSINPILRLRGPVASGYGRGGKKLGVPTANLPSSLFQSALEGVTNGVYFGWAVIEETPNDENDTSTKKGRSRPIKAVVNVGYSPTFEGEENKEKIVEAHLITKKSPMERNDLEEDTTTSDDGGLHMDDMTDFEIEGDFYGETMRLQLIGYLRPEQKFDSFPELVAQIHRDIGNANLALDSMPFVFSKEDGFVKSGLEWKGSGGGDGTASWEFESW